MVIKDLRKEKFLQIDVKLILEKIINNSPSDLYNGLDRILILDTDYRKRALGRHRPKKKMEVMKSN